ncbi:MAG: FkbM family methyltransferase [Thermoanaerobaculia bacterium]
MSTLRRFAKFVRHLPWMERQERFWSLLRRPYHLALDVGGRGVKVRIGGKLLVRIPAEYAGAPWEDYEPEAVAALAGWLAEHPTGRVLDVGCSIGILSAAAIFSGPAVEVVAFDSDLSSVAAAMRMCRHARGERLQVVHGFLSNDPTELCSLAVAVSATKRELARTGLGGEPGTTRFACITDIHEDSAPARRLDDLMAPELENGLDIRPTLLKCDVEGAELLVLRGGANFLRKARPELLLSVHPPALPSYGHSTGDVEAFLRQMDYEVHCLAIDHEEHWWCEPKETL